MGGAVLGRGCILGGTEKLMEIPISDPADPRANYELLELYERDHQHAVMLHPLCVTVPLRENVPGCSLKKV